MTAVLHLPPTDQRDGRHFCTLHKKLFVVVREFTFYVKLFLGSGGLLVGRCRWAVWLHIAILIYKSNDNDDLIGIEMKNVRQRDSDLMVLSEDIFVVGENSRDRQRLI